MQSAFIALSITLFVLSGPLLALLAAPPGDGPILVIAPGEAHREGMVRQAGGQVLGPVQGLLGTLAISQDPDFPKHLRDSGAWFVVDGRSVAALCGVTS